MQKVISVSTMRELDKLTINTKCSSLALMKKAGDESFFAIKKNYKKTFKNKKVLIVCGKGNNAGDGYVIANHLLKEKAKVYLYLFSKDFSNDGKFYFDKICSKCNIILDEKNSIVNDFNNFDLIIDCIFGTGFKGKVLEPYRSIINKINASKKSYIVSIDINSGLNGDFGLCDICVKSDLTISIGYLKTGHILNMAKDFIKKLVNVDIGIIEAKDYFYLLEKKDIKKTFKERKHFSNKGNYGYIALIGGSDKYSGALKLAHIANYSMRSGAGVVKVASPDCISSVIQNNILESTYFPLKSKNGMIKFNKKEIDELISNVKTIAFGMGAGVNEEIIKLTKYLISTWDKFLLIDSSGLECLSKIDLKLLKNSKAKIVLTPHPKEFERLLNNSILLKKFNKKKFTVKDILENGIEYATAFSKEYAVVLLLKGTTSIITNGNVLYLSNAGSPGMASGGSGDLLSGVIAGRLFSETEDFVLNVASSAYITGIAGEIADELYGSISMLASDTASCLNIAIKMLS